MATKRTSDKTPSPDKKTPAQEGGKTPSRERSSTTEKKAAASKRSSKRTATAKKGPAQPARSRAQTAPSAAKSKPATGSRPDSATSAATDSKRTAKPEPAPSGDAKKRAGNTVLSRPDAKKPTASARTTDKESKPTAAEETADRVKTPTATASETSSTGDAASKPGEKTGTPLAETPKQATKTTAEHPDLPATEPKAAVDSEMPPEQESLPGNEMREPAPAVSVPPPIEQTEAPSPQPPPEPEPVHEHPVPQTPTMFIVQITPELAPVAKVGGLADVVTGLTRELEIRGNAVEIVMPKYDCMRYDQIRDLHITYQDLWVPWYDGAVHCSVWFGFVRDHKCFFIEPHSNDNFFNRGTIYGFDDDILRFAFFSRAAIEFLWKAGKHPEIIHCHDWQTALVPVFLYEIYQQMGMTHPRVCYTIHNFKHQGVTGDFILNATGLNRPDYYFHPDRLLDNHIPHAINLMKGGIVYSNFVTTVSPRHAGEAMQDQGFGLEPTLHTHHAKFGGVVNGVDYDVWNPEIDQLIPFRYNVDSIDEKYKNKQALRSRLLLADSEKPIVAFIGRLDPQKGLELVRHALFHTLNNRGQFVLLGSSPDPEINTYFWELKRHLNDSPDCHIEVGFDEELAHLIYCGADMMVVPSRFEPCGLTQLIAMRYGTIPIVRAVGGLSDTVFDKDHSDKPLHERNGYVFNDYDDAGLESALNRAIACYYDFPEHFRELMKNAMRSDYSWNHPGQHYLNIYDYIREK